ncbi:MAG: glycerol-3-phosphate 1-O-acyltransferase PlsY [Oscillospiraceae bacterium]|nr:glycerol-3-phosphate 1-O-acyltransferase PlsY [Oscillospiraceae bacterium]
MWILMAVIAAAIGYLLGSINSAIISVRLLKHEDVRQFGSGNAGLTNTMRCFGKGCGFLTLFGDLTKGVLAVFLSQFIAYHLIGETADLYFFGAMAGIFAIVGHVFPLYYHFKGGKGVLVGVSLFLVLDWRVFCILMCIFGIILLCSKIVSLSSIIATACCPLITFLMQFFLSGGQWTLPWILIHVLQTVIMATVIIASHHENISRLRNGTERKIGQKKAAPEDEADAE